MNIKLLRKKDFTLLMFAKLVSLLGTQMQDFALSLYVLKTTGSASKFASVLAVAVIPQIVIGPFTGVFVDWFDRKKIIVSLDMFDGIMIAYFVFIYFAKGELSLGSIYVLVIIISVISVIYQPAIGTVIPSIMKDDELVDANAISTFIMNIGNIASPVLGGALYGIFGLPLILVLNSASFIIASFAEMFMKLPKTNKMPEKIDVKTFFSDFGSGFKFILSKGMILSIIITAAVVNFAFAPFSVIITYVLKDVLSVSDFSFGIAEAVIMTAMFIGPVLTSLLSKRLSSGKMIYIGLIASSLVYIGTSVIPHPRFLRMFDSNFGPFVCVITACFLILMFVSVANIAVNILFQKVVPLSMMGRAGSVMNMLCLVGTPLGQMISGLLLDKINVSICILIPGLMILLVILCFRKSLCS